MADQRSVEAIERDLAEARQRLSDNLAQLVSEIHPKVVTRRTVAEGKHQAQQLVASGKEKAQESLDWVKARFKDESGWNPRSIAIAGTVAVAVVALIVVTAKKK